MSLNSLIFIDHLPKLDIHGLDRDTSKIKVKEFIIENYFLNNKYCVIIHGMGMGILKKTVHAELAKMKRIKAYKTWFFNSGCTIIELEEKLDL